MQKKRRGVAVVIKRVLFSYMSPDVGASCRVERHAGVDCGMGEARCTGDRGIWSPEPGADARAA